MDPRFFYGNLWSGNFYPALRQLDNEIIESQTDLLPTSRFLSVPDGFTREEVDVRAKITDQILEEVRAAHRQEPIHLFLSYFYNSHFDPEGFKELRRLGIPSVNFFCNSIYQFDLVAAIAAKVEFSWHTERDARSSYLGAGASPVWVQMAADSDMYRYIPNVVRETKACFVGQRYADRDRLAAALLRANVPLDLYGAGWGAEETENISDERQSRVYLGRRYRSAGSAASYWQTAKSVLRAEGPSRGLTRLRAQWGYRSDTRRLSPLLLSSAKGKVQRSLPEVYANYEVVLNFSNVWADGRPGSRLIPHVRLRDFEAPMCRTCYLTAHTDEIADLYKVGREVDTYCSASELIDKTRYYLSHPEAAERLRTAGYERARCDHTWTRRFQELFQSIGLRKKVSLGR